MKKFYRRLKKKSDSRSRVDAWRERINNNNRYNDYAPLNEVTNEYEYHDVEVEEISLNNRFVVIKKILGKILFFTIIFISIFIIPYSPVSQNANLKIFFILLITLVLLFSLIYRFRLSSIKLIIFLTIMVLLISFIGSRNQIYVNKKPVLKYSKTSQVFASSKILLNYMRISDNRINYLSQDVNLLASEKDNFQTIYFEINQDISFLKDLNFPDSKLSEIRDILLESLINQNKSLKIIENHIQINDKKNLKNILEFNSNASTLLYDSSEKLGLLCKSYKISLRDLNSER